MAKRPTSPKPTASATPEIANNEVIALGDWNPDNMTITDRYKVKKNQNDTEPVEVTTTFDFSDMSIGDIAEIALASVRIRLQAVIRDQMAAGAFDAKAHRTCKVKDLGARERRAADPAKKAANVLDKMSETERAAFIKRMMEQYGVNA